MAVVYVDRTMRDGAITIKDGTGTPLTCTVLCDEGDLRWSERDEIVVSRCRGQVTSRRYGDDQLCELSFTARWQNLVNAAVEAGSANYVPYEFINFLPTEMVSTETGVNALDYHFTVTDPSDTPTATELIVFPDVVKTQLDCSEGSPNTISFSGQSSATKPTITQP